MSSGIVYNIQRFSIQDGPGIRTTVFLKGCPLRCLWCSNPESQESAPQLLYFDEHCVGCQACAAVCPQQANIMVDGRIVIDRTKCTACGRCTQVCLYDCRSISGRAMTVEEVMEVVRKDYQHYLNSDGGVTVSGGEATLQPEFLLDLLAAVRSEGFHTCVDTCCLGRTETFEALLPLTDLFLVDCKHMDSKAHSRFMGVDNSLIHKNMRFLSEHGAPVRIRIPLIPGCNDTFENMHASGAFLKELGFFDVDVIPYHRLGTSKYRALGRPYEVEDGEPDVAAAKEILKSYGLRVSII